MPISANIHHTVRMTHMQAELTPTPKRTKCVCCTTGNVLAVLLAYRKKLHVAFEYSEWDLLCWETQKIACEMGVPTQASGKPRVDEQAMTAHEVHAMCTAIHKLATNGEIGGPVQPSEINYIASDIMLALGHVQQQYMLHHRIL